MEEREKDPNLELAIKVQKQAMEIEELNKKIRHLEFTYDQDVTKLKDDLVQEQTKYKEIEEALSSNEYLLRLSELEIEHDNMSVENMELKRKLAEHMDAAIHLQSKLEELDKSKATLIIHDDPSNKVDVKLYEEAEARVDHLTQNKIELQQEISHLNQKNSESEEKIHRLESEKAELNQELVKIKELVYEALAEKDDFIAKQNIEIEKLKNTQIKIDESSSEFIDVEMMREFEQKLITVTEELNKHKEEKVVLEGHIDELKLKNNSDRREYEELIESYKQELALKNKEKEEIRDQFLANKGGNSELEEEIQELKEKLRKAEDKQLELQQKYHDKENEYLEMKTEVEIKQKQMDLLNEGIKEADKMKLSYEKQLTEKQKKYMGQIKNAEEKANKAEAERDSLQKKNSTLEFDFKATLEELKALKTRIEEREKTFKDTTDNLHNEIRQLKDELYNKENELLKEISNGSKKLADAKEEYESQLEKALEYEKRIHEDLLRKISEHHESQKSESGVQIASEQAELLKNIDDLKLQISALNSENETLKTELQDFKTKAEIQASNKTRNVIAELELLKVKNNSLEKSVGSLKEQWSKEVEFLKKELDTAEVMAAEARVNYADMATQKDYSILQFRQLQTKYKELQAKSNQQTVFQPFTPRVEKRIFW